MSLRWKPIRVFTFMVSIGMLSLSWGSLGLVTPSGAAPRDVSPLELLMTPLPPVKLPNYRTSGTYPQVSSDKVDVTAVNAALRGAVLTAQRQYEQYVRRRWIPEIPDVFRPAYRYTGEYTAQPKLGLISASTVVVSALIPLRRRLPGGTGGETWLSTTVHVPSGSRVGLRDLFAEPSRGLRALAMVARRNLLSTNSCIGASARNPVYARGFAPTVANYDHYALTTTGLVVGFWQEQVGAPTCGSVIARVPYSALRPHFSALGKRLIAGVRRPQVKR